MTKQFPRNGIEFAQFTDEGRGTFGVYKNRVRYTDKSSGQSKDIHCKNNAEALSQARAFTVLWKLEKEKREANS